MLHIYLASSSPSRRWILDTESLSFTVIPQHADERSLEWQSWKPVALVQELALMKNNAADLSACVHDSFFVLSADTVTVASTGEILGKPADRSDGYRMLRLLHKPAEVVTGYCISHYVKNKGSLSCLWREVNSAVVTVDFYVPEDKFDEYFTTVPQALYASGGAIIDDNLPGHHYLRGISGDPRVAYGLPIADLKCIIEKYLSTSEINF